MTYLLTVVGLTPGGSSTVHIYTQTIHGTTQWKEKIQNMTIRIHKHNNKNTSFTKLNKSIQHKHNDKNGTKEYERMW